MFIFFGRENLQHLECTRKEDELQNWAVSIGAGKK